MNSVYALLADIFDYPGAALWGSLPRLIELLAEDFPETAAAFTAFRGVLESMGLARFQEMYIQAFDFRADCSLYIGHYLFGESGRRGVFLAELSDRYRERGLASTADVPDHMSCLLRYLAAIEPGEEASELIHACLIPAISRITAAAILAKSPYRAILEALPVLLRQNDNDGSQIGEFPWTSSSSLYFRILP